MAIDLEVDSADEGKRRIVDQNIASWNRIADWLRHVEGLQQAA